MAKKIAIGGIVSMDGEASFRKAISGINSDMKVLASEMKLVSAEFADNKNSVEALTAKDTILNKQLETQKEKVEALQKALKNSQEAYGDNDTRVDQWKISLNNAEAELSKLDSELKNNDKYLDEAKGSTSGLATSIDNYGKEVKTAGDNTLKTGDIIKANLTSDLIIGGVKTLGSAMKNVAEGTINLVTETAAYADNMLTLSTQTGVTTDKLQAYNYMAELTDTSLETLTGSMAKNIKSMTNAQNGSEKYEEAYKKLKVEWEDGNGKLRDSEEVYWDVIDALKDVTDETERDSISMQLFGKSAQELNTVIGLGSDGISKFTEEAESMGAVLDEDTLTSLGATDDAIQRLTQAADIAKREFGAAMAPAMTEAAEKITEKVTNMDDSFAELAGGALNVAIDGLGWIVNNAGLISGGIGGIATGMAVFKAGSAIQTGMNLAVAAWKTYKTATEGATVAQYAMNFAQNLSPVGILATAVGALTAGLIIYNTTANDTTAEMDAFNEALEEAKTANEQFHESIEDNITSRRESATSIEKEYGAIQIMSDKLYDLAEKENLSNSEKAQMTSIISELNKAMPDLNLIIDEETGLLSKNRVAMDELIITNLEYSKVKGAMESLSGIASDLAAEEIKLSEAQEKRTVKQKEFNDVMKTVLEVNRLNAVGYVWLSSEEKKYVDENKNAIETAGQLSSELKVMNEDIQASEDHVGTLGTQWQTTSDYIGDHSDIANATIVVDKFGNVVEETSDTIVLSNEEAKDAIDELTKTYETAVADRTKDIKNAMGLFDKFATNTEISGKTLMKNLESQVKGMQEWADNLQALAKKGIDEGLLKELQEMGTDAASEIAALNQLSEPELQAYSDMWQEKSELARKLAVKELKTLKDETVAQVKAISNAASGEMYLSGQNAIDGFTNGFKSKRLSMNTVMGNTFDDAVANINAKLGIHSPSTVFAAMGLHSAEGYAQGITNGKGMIKKSLEEVNDAILSGAKNKLSNYKVYNDLTLEKEVEFWNELRKQFKKGTQARIDADKEYYAAKDELKAEPEAEAAKILSDAKIELDTKKIYHKMSLDEEVEYWDGIRGQFKEGTKARIDADKEYFTVKHESKAEQDKINEEMLKAEETYRDNVKKVSDDLVKNVQAVTDEYNNAVESRTNSIVNSLGLFDEFSKKTDVSGQQLISNLQSQVIGISNWSDGLNQLKNRGISDGLLSELQNMGVGASGEISALNSLTDEQLTQYVLLWQQKSKLAKDQAVGELVGLKTETSTKIQELTVQANKDLKNYNKEYKAAMKELGETIKEPVTKLKTTIATDGKEIVANVTKAIQKEAKSKTTSDRVDTVSDTIKASLSTTISSANSIGINVVQGMIQGMNSQKHELAIAASSLVSMTVTAAKKAGKINSPSQLMRDEVGYNLARGISIGFSDEMKNVAIEMNNIIPTDFTTNDANNMSTSTSGNSLSGNGIDYNKMAQTFISALKTFSPNVVLDDEKIGTFVINTVMREVVV